MMKMIVAFVVMLSLAFSPVGEPLFQSEKSIVSAKSYRSGKRSFNRNNNIQPRQNEPRSNFNNRRNNDADRGLAARTNRGGFVRGLFYGGIAGLLFGGMLGHFGAFGGILGLLINMLAIALLINLIRRAFSLFKKNKRENEWR
ncbi:hypothetical protein FZC66_10050 [Priestia megaterium]|nr:hypothetical protein FZC66_10050 [Priestia megaterium]